MSRLTPLVIDAKLARPRPTGVVDRPRLRDLLEAGVGGHRLTLVVAGAGYGKTTLLAELSRRGPGAIAWYTLGGEDAEFTSFLAHLAAALRGVRRHYGRSLRSFLRDGAVEPRRAATAAGVLLNDLHRIQDPVTFVLDDFHLVAESEPIRELLGQVLEGNEGPVRFVIASRHEPPLPLARLRARRQLFEIGAADLAFTPDELRRFLETVHHHRTTDAELHFLSRSTEGWITPVQLALQATRDRAELDLARAFERAMASGAPLHDYLADEVLSGETAERRDWMLRTSPFDEIEAGLLSAVLDEPDPEARLGELARRGLLHAFEGARTTVYRYHVLLRDLLRRRFAAEIPVAEQERIHRAAAEWYRSRGDLVQAGGHLAGLTDRSELAGFLHGHAVDIVDTGQSEALTRLFESLPAERISADPWLRLRLADARQFLGDWGGIL